ncbi:MAG: 30S ribosomal protein S1 [Oscillibacter sp.]|jgi:small subunit ribosomal protein S1|nr:S1 RNA-binding domain-containing protein [uncultured Oscillibacter sp.]MCI8813209.1 30S ribosomal protein S1 [Oscillibacter sp.]
MPENKLFLPEGLCPPVRHTLDCLREALESGAVLEAPVQRCDAGHTLHIDLDGIPGRISRSEAIAPWINGAGRDIAVLSRVGKPTCFQVLSLQADEKGAPAAVLSRRAAQEAAMDFFLQNLEPGMVLTCRVTRLEPYGAFLDIGCGIIAILPIELISVSRISHPGARLQEGQKILAAVRSFDRENRRITMTTRELLGTWMENASRFAPGETVRGTVRSVKEYGSFIELAPNLSGLADSREDLSPGDGVSVFIKSIRPERMKIKLQVIEKLPPQMQPEPLRYQITDGKLDRWTYSPPGYEKEPVETVFTAPVP